MKNKAIGNFTIVPNQIINDSDLDGNSIWLWLQIAQSDNIPDWDHLMWKISENMKVTTRTLYKKIHVLVQKGYLIRERKNKHNHYHYSIPVELKSVLFTPTLSEEIISQQNSSQEKISQEEFSPLNNTIDNKLNDTLNDTLNDSLNDTMTRSMIGTSVRSAQDTLFYRPSVYRFLVIIDFFV